MATCMYVCVCAVVSEAGQADCALHQGGGGSVATATAGTAVTDYELWTNVFSRSQRSEVSHMTSHMTCQASSSRSLISCLWPLYMCLVLCLLYVGMYCEINRTLIEQFSTNEQELSNCVVIDIMNSPPPLPPSRAGGRVW